MPIFNAVIVGEDSYGRQTRKSYKSQNLTDFATAQAALTDLVTDFEAASQLGVVRTYLTEETAIAGSPDSGSNIDAGMTITVKKVNTKKASIKVPAPVTSVVNVDGTIDITNAIITDFIANFQTGGDWTVSDGEIVSSIVKGSLDE